MNNALPIIAILVSILSIIIQYFVLMTKVYERLAKLETKTELFWKCVEGGIVKMLKSYPTNICKDVLLDKMLHDELTLEDAQTLRTILKEEMNLDKEKALVYVLALGRIEQVIYSLQGKKEKKSNVGLNI
jgi:hypothetical protein